MSDRTVGFAIHWANWNWALRFLRLMALGIAGVIILLWFVVRMEQINSYRGIETTRATELSATPYLGASYKARTMSKEILPRVRLAAQAAVLQEGRQIARTASLRISVADFSVARESLDRIVSASGGFVTTLNISYPRDSARSLAAQLAIPSAQRETALEELRKLGRVEEETQGSEEVAVQSEDLDIRLKNARDEEGRLANILRIGTGKVSDVLEVENEQTRVR